MIRGSEVRKNRLHLVPGESHSAGKRTGTQAEESSEGIILLGTTAYRAFRESRASATSPATFSDFVPSRAGSNRLNMLNDALVLAMYSVARADRALDSQRRKTIRALTSHIGLRDVDSGTLISILQFDPDPSLVAAMTRTLGERLTVYLASIVAADPDNVSERWYLETLEARLKIPESVVPAIQRRARELRQRLDQSSYFGFPIDHYEVASMPQDIAS